MKNKNNNKQLAMCVTTADCGSAMEVKINKYN